MEQKQLNFNAPLLSVRRLSSSTQVSSEETHKPKTGKNQPTRQHSLPIQKIDNELGDLTKPATIPFRWEQTPGRVKGESGPQRPVPEEPSVTPKLPPGRISGILSRLSSEVYGEKKSNSEMAQFKEHAALLESLANGIDDESGADISSEDDDAYSDDTHDTLLLPDSFMRECSVSGISGYNQLDEKPPCGTFLADQNTRDFIMSRFLPAAKAMVLEIPQFSSRKVGTESPPVQPAKKFYSGELRPLRDQYGLNPILNYNKHVEKNNDDDDEDGFDDEVRKKQSKACGFFPRLCVKNSLFLLNPVPGMKSRASMPAAKSRAKISPPSPASEVRRMSRRAHSGPLPQMREKHTSDLIYRKSSQLVAKTKNLLEAENKLTSNKPNECPNLIDSFKTDLPQERPRGGGRSISPYRNEAPRSPFHDGARFLGVPKKFEGLEGNNFGSLIKACDNFLAVSSHKNSKASGPVVPVAEKTLYIDSNVKSNGVMAGRVTLDHEVQNEDVIITTKGSEDSKKDSFESSLPPLLPKSPSESWLWQTLPSVSLRNPFSPKNNRKQGQKSPKAVGAKWETIVKTSNVHHDHVRYSEELLSHNSPHSKT